MAQMVGVGVSVHVAGCASVAAVARRAWGRTWEVNSLEVDREGWHHHVKIKWIFFLKI